MDPALNTLTRRPGSLRVAAALAGLAVLALTAVLQTALRPTALWTGGLLYGMVLGLALFNSRKKLPFLPLAHASTWLQIHLYAGWVSLLVFFLHTGWHWPQGRLEQLVATMFLITALSGVFGWYLSRRIPPRLTRSGEPLLYERIPVYRQQIRTQIEEIVRTTERESGSTTFADFYLDHLSAYLDHRLGLFAPLMGSNRMHAEIMSRLKAQDRYLHPDERASAAKLAEWLEAHRNLEVQSAGQRLLRLWLFIHIPATYSLLLLGAMHGALAWLYSGGH